MNLKLNCIEQKVGANPISFTMLIHRRKVGFIMHFISVLESREYLITLAKLATPNEDNSWLPEFQGKICQLLSVLKPKTELSSVVEGTELHCTLSKEWKEFDEAQEELQSFKVKTTYINDKLSYAFKGVGYQVNATYRN